MGGAGFVSRHGVALTLAGGGGGGRSAGRRQLCCGHQRSARLVAAGEYHQIGPAIGHQRDQILSRHFEQNMNILVAHSFLGANRMMCITLHRSVADSCNVMQSVIRAAGMGAKMPANTKQDSRSAQRITVSLSPRDHTELAALAERCDVSLSWVARQAISEFLERHAKGELQLPLNLDTRKAAQHE